MSRIERPEKRIILTSRITSEERARLQDQMDNWSQPLPFLLAATQQDNPNFIRKGGRGKLGNLCNLYNDMGAG